MMKSIVDRGGLCKLEMEIKIPYSLGILPYLQLVRRLQYDVRHYDSTVQVGNMQPETVHSA